MKERIPRYLGPEVLLEIVFLEPSGNLLRGYEIADDAELIAVCIHVTNRLCTVWCNNPSAVLVSIFDSEFDGVLFD